MGAEPLSAHGFVSVRGRGYRPEQVDLRVSVLCRQRDDLWERAARLTVLAKQMEGEAERLRERVAALVPQTYATLGPRAQRILAITVEEDEAVRAGARAECQALLDAAEATARRVHEAAVEQADAVRAEAEAHAQEVLDAARGVAEEQRIEARRGIKERRGEELVVLKEVRRRTQDVIDDLEQEQAERLAVMNREFADREAALEVEQAELAAYAEARLVDAQRVFSEAGERARRCQEDAQAKAAELGAQARARAEGMARETERVLGEHAEAREEMQAHMTRVQNSLVALTGRAAAEG
ncbi:cellulose-binding protein [Streptomyces sp. NPDC088400]|uniref:cellulose-binding protein n=1 Tax=Streptomyces sp. NPDC088400 TaxID=3365861 RepID=UPI003801DD39